MEFCFSQGRPVLPLIILSALYAQGAGRQSKGVFVNLVAYYIVGLPIGVLLTFKYKFDVSGLVLGLILGTLIQMVFYSSIVLHMDWRAEARNAQARVASRLADMIAASVREDVSSNAHLPAEDGGESQLQESLLQSTSASLPAEAIDIALKRQSSRSLDLPRASPG